MEDFLNQVISINNQITDLQNQRNHLVTENSREILNRVFKMMDWRKDILSTAMVEYSDFEKQIMITVWLKTDKNARYVFSLGKSGNPQLRFREDFSLK